MTRSTWLAERGQALLEVAEPQVPGRVGLALGGGEELVDVAPGDVRELLAELERRHAAPRSDGAQQRAGEGTRAGTGLDDARAGEDVGERDDLGGVLGVDHGRSARHGHHELVEQRAEDEVLPARGGDEREALLAADHVVVVEVALVGEEPLARARARSCACGPCCRPGGPTRPHAGGRGGRRTRPRRGRREKASDMARTLVFRGPISLSGDRCRGTPGRRRRSTAPRRSGRRPRRGGTPPRGVRLMARTRSSPAMVAGRREPLLERAGDRRDRHPGTALARASRAPPPR